MAFKAVADGAGRAVPEDDGVVVSAGRDQIIADENHRLGRRLMPFQPSRLAPRCGPEANGVVKTRRGDQVAAGGGRMDRAAMAGQLAEPVRIGGARNQ